MKHLFIVVLLVAQLIIIACGIAAIVTGIKLLRNYRGEVAQGAWKWLSIGIAALVISGVTIFLYGR